MEDIISAESLFLKLYENVCLYFFEIIFVSLLSIITIFRREMSCNAVYTEDDGMIDSLHPEEDRYSLLSSYSYSSNGMLKSRSNHELAKLYEYNYSASNNNGHSNGSDTNNTTDMDSATMDSNSNVSSRPVNLLDLPADIQIKCFSFLSPKDILKFSCVNCLTYDMVSNERAHVDIPRENSISNLLWYQLFLRDYASVLTEWHAGMKAVERSRSGGDSLEHYDRDREREREHQCASESGKDGTPSSSLLNFHQTRWHCPDKISLLLGGNKECQVSGRNGVSSTWKPSMKEFYLVFSQTWLEYSIAGQTQSPTLVGIHGHVFDMTSFLEEHPGSPETIIMQGGGRDATHFFETVGHSRSARSLALERLLEVVDFGCCSSSTNNDRPNRRRRRRSVGRQYDHCISTSGYCDSSLKRSNENGLKVVCDREERDVLLEDISSQYKNVLPQKRSERKRSPGTLYHTRVKLTSEAQRAKLEARAKVTRQMSERGEMDILGNVNVYFDPLCYCWKGWYLNLDFQSVFVHDVRNIRQK